MFVGGYLVVRKLKSECEKKRQKRQIVVLLLFFFHLLMKMLLLFILIFLNHTDFCETGFCVKNNTKNNTSNNNNILSNNTNNMTGTGIIITQGLVVVQLSNCSI